MSDTDDFGLSQKQRLYAEGVAAGMDEEDAATQAGFDAKMVSALKTHPLVKTAVAALSKARIEKMKMSQEEAEIHLKRMAEPEFSDFYEQKEDGSFAIKSNIAPEKMAAIKEIREIQGKQVVILHNRETLLDKVLRRHGAYSTKHIIEGQIDHKHTHEIDTRGLIEKMDQLLKHRPKQVEVIDIESEPVDALYRSPDE